ncbi:MAG: PEP-CTERM sorting domain-containing protein [Planctomycetales bacterium]|nr:PEP-CTERM sorting domain-containing protein [Planctomycetales bacterium]
MAYHDAGDLAGFTVLTVTAAVPEPASTLLLVVALAAGHAARRPRRPMR